MGEEDNDNNKMEFEDCTDFEVSTQLIQLVLVKVSAPELLGVADLI